MCTARKASGRKAKTSSFGFHGHLWAHHPTQLLRHQGGRRLPGPWGKCLESAPTPKQVARVAGTHPVASPMSAWRPQSPQQSPSCGWTALGPNLGGNKAWAWAWPGLRRPQTSPGDWPSLLTGPLAARGRGARGCQAGSAPHIPRKPRLHFS